MGPDGVHVIGRMKDNGHTFAFVDLAGFSALTEAHGDREAADLVDQFEDMTRSVLSVEDKLIKTIGDAVMLVSTTPRHGLELVRRVADACLAMQRFPVPRAGLHHGSAVERRGDFVGAAVNLAARVTAQAIEGTAVMTSVVVRDAEQLGWPVTPLGWRNLRNIPAAVELWALELDRRSASTYIDPVCRMRIAEDHVVGNIRHDGVDFRFCSLECLSTFAAAPGHYTHGTTAP